MQQTSDSHDSPSVGEVLSFAELQAGDPHVLSSPKALEAPVNWVHVLTGPSAISLLDGGELILTTGAGWPQDSPSIKTLAKALVRAGVVAIVLELGQHFNEIPQALIDECEAQDVALISLNKEVRFVQITQRVHKRILAAQNESLEARDKVHQMLTELGLKRSPVDFMIAQMAVLMGAPVVLENIAGEVIAWAAPENNLSANEVLRGWNGSRSSTNHTPDPHISFEVDDAQPENSAQKDDYARPERVAVEARGKRWGTLTALPGPAHPAGRRTVLELGAFALALGRLSDPDGDEWLRLTSKQLIDTLLSGRYRNDIDLETQLAASGLPISDRDLMAVSLTGLHDFGAHLSLERAVIETALRRAVSPEGKVLITDTPEWFNDQTSTANGISILALVSLPRGDERTKTKPETNSMPTFASALARELDMLVPMATPGAWRVHLSIGVTGHGVAGLLASAEGVKEAGPLPAWGEIGRVSVQLAANQPLTYLLRSFAGSPALQTFVTEQLGPLIEYDKKRGSGYHGDLLLVLAAYLAHPNNRSQAAKEARLSRSVFYARLELIEDLLGVELDSGDTIASLAVALKAHRI
ncbi:MAG TPA: PucR family transcriptional regulator [Microbacteriaceae bacterium]|nr:PucR family transcriptional regulator [Microbacteriaceae bacterium]